MMLHRSPWLALACSSVLALSSSKAAAEGERASPPPTNAGSPTTRSARDAAEAARAVERGDLERARSLLTEAARVEPGYETLGNLGAVELALQHHRDCATHLSQSLRAFPPNASEALRQTTTEKLRICLLHVESHHVNVTPNGSEVTVDGRVVGTTPLADPLFLDPGHHVIRASRRGLEPATREVTAVAGAEVHDSLTLAPSTSRGPFWPVLAGGVGALVLFGTAIGLQVASSSTEEDGDALKAQLAASGKRCPEDCAALIDTYDSASSKRNAATGMFVTGSLAAAGTAAYYLIVRPKPEGTRPEWFPIFGGDRLGLGLRSSF